MTVKHARAGPFSNSQRHLDFVVPSSILVTSLQELHVLAD